MLTNAILLVLLAIATYTDWRWRKIYNWTTYTGILAGLLLNAVATLGGFDLLSGSATDYSRYGLIGLGESLTGFAACGGLMVVCYVFFPGGVGGGDVKLVAMIGALVGLTPGLETLLWTFLIGGCTALVLLVWQAGALAMLARAAKLVFYTVRLGSPVWGDDDRRPLRAPLLLAPSAALAVMIVQLRLVEWFS